MKYKTFSRAQKASWLEAATVTYLNESRNQALVCCVIDKALVAHGQAVSV